MKYCLIDESDPADQFECEGDVLKTFFNSAGIFNSKKSLAIIRKSKNIEQQLKKRNDNYFNIVQFSAHGIFEEEKKLRLANSSIVHRRGNMDIEIFRPDSIVRTGLKADVFLSTNCQTFNHLFIDTLKHYKGVSNYIAPINSPYIGYTLIFSMMFYNKLLRMIRKNSTRISDLSILNAFIATKKAIKKYDSNENFHLYNVKSNRIFK